MSGREPAAGRDPVEDYLDQLYAELRTSPRAGRRILAETEEHLRDAVADGLADGLPEDEARRRAVERFGPPRAVARAHGGRLYLALARLAGLLGAVGLVAVGLSGVLAAGMNAVFGHDFVGGTPAGTTWSAADCRHFLAVWPSAHTCARAAVLENSQDAVSLRVLAGVVGLILLAGYRLAGRRLGDGRLAAAGALPESLRPTVATVVFGAAGVLLTAMALDTVAVNHGHGAGFYLSGGLAALAVALGYAVALRRALLVAGRA